MSSPDHDSAPAPGTSQTARARGDLYAFDLGVSGDRPYVVRLDLDSSHGLISGPAGSGKTNALQLIAGQALDKGWLLKVADPRRTDWATWTERPGTTVVSDLAGLASMLDDVADEAAHRRALLAAHEAPSIRDLSIEQAAQPILVVVDLLELFVYADHVDSPEAAASNGLREHAIARLTMILREGRALGMHVMAAMNRAVTTPLWDVVAADFGLRAQTGPAHMTGWQLLFRTREGYVERIPRGIAHVQPRPGARVVPVRVPCVAV